MKAGKKIDLKFYGSLDTPRIARGLLGSLLVVPAPDGERVSGMIVETEAYLGEIDRAAHSFSGRRTPRNEVMYGPAGRVYVFFVYGMYYQFNVVTGPADHPHAILIRALEPAEGVETMRERRSKKRSGKAAATRRPLSDKDLTSGPGKLAIALGIDRGLNGELLTGGKAWIEHYRQFSDKEIDVGKRVGIDYAGEDADLPLRFSVKGNPFVSRGR